MSACAQLTPARGTHTTLSGGPAPAERHVFAVCNGEQCRDAGAGDLLGLLRHHCSHSGADVRVSSSTRCMGHCNVAPTVMADGRVMGWVSLRRLKSELMRLGLLRMES